MKRVYIKKGDVFVVKIDDKNKRYFQYITNDLKQLNSDVIRCFKKIYSIHENPSLDEIIKDEIFYAFPNHKGQLLAEEFDGYRTEFIAGTHYNAMTPILDHDSSNSKIKYIRKVY